MNEGRSSPMQLDEDEENEGADVEKIEDIIKKKLKKDIVKQY